MNATDTAREILEIMLRHLGYAAEITVDSCVEAPGLQVSLADPSAAPALTGKNGERLDDLQHLVNKLLRQKLPGAPRVRIDVNHLREARDHRFLEAVREAAGRVRSTGESLKLDPMNSYQRRLVHHLFLTDPDVTTWSPEDDSRMKRITLLPRK